VESAWVDLEDFREQFPNFQLEDELLLKEGRDVMYSRTFGRRSRQQGGTGAQD
jgi:transcriptional regulator GlxA family with amidase domain